jgi:hypothetical protein
MDENINPEINESPEAQAEKKIQLSPESILDRAVDQTSSTTVGPTDSAVLAAESNRTGEVKDKQISVRSSPIETSAGPGQAEAIRAIETSPSLGQAEATRAIEKANSSNSIARTTSLDQVPTSQSSVTSNNVTNSNTVVNSTTLSNATDQSSNRSDTYEGDFTQIINQYFQDLTPKSEEVVRTKSTNLKADAIMTGSKKAADQAVKSVASGKPEAILAEQNSNKSNKLDESISMEKEFMQVYNTFQEQVNGGSIIQKTDASTNSTNNVTVKSKNIMEPSAIQKAVSPDRTVEKAVETQTRTLNESLNTLTTNVSNISPTTSSSVVNNAGQTVNQTTVNAERPVVQVPMKSEQDYKPTQPSDSGKPGSDFYLQAIYSAIMSGKIKVKLEY